MRHVRTWRSRYRLSRRAGRAKPETRRTVTNYGFLPNYRNYGKEAGYVEEMDAIERAIAEGRRDDVPKYFSDKWLADNTLFGPAAKVREDVAARQDAGVA